MKLYIRYDFLSPSLSLSLSLSLSRSLSLPLILSPSHSLSQDLEEQSRLIAASSRPANPPSSDGQFLVLSNSQSEDSDAGEEGKKQGESDA